MDKVQLRDSPIAVSRLIFGTGGLHHLRSSKERQNLLSAAADCGFSHFDTSPFYGFGLAERDLGDFLTDRWEIGVTTKVGLYPRGGDHQPSWMVFGRKAFGRVVPKLSRPVVDFTIARARQSLETSLKRLRRERIDLLLLHEPEAELLATAEWIGWLNSEVARGRIGDFGAAGAPGAVSRLRDHSPNLARLVQTGGGDSLLEPLDPQIRYGLVRGLGPGPGDAKVRSVIAREIAARPDRALIVGTRTAERLPALASAAGG